MTEENEIIEEEVDVSGTEEVTEEQEHSDFLEAMGDEAPEEEEVDELAGISDSVIAAIEAKLAEKLTGQIEQKLSGRLRNIEGHIGGLKHGLTQLSAAAKAAESQGAEAPTTAQVKEAAASGEKLEALKEDFPEWAEAIKESMDAVSARIPQVDVDGINQRINTNSQDMLYKARQMARLDNAYPDWEQTVQSDAYRNWLANQPNELQALTASDNATDALKVLKEYASASNKSLTASSRQNKLENAITPTTGGQVTRRQPKTEHEAFLAAFNNRG